MTQKAKTVKRAVQPRTGTRASRAYVRPRGQGCSLGRPIAGTRNKQRS